MNETEIATAAAQQGKLQSKHQGGRFQARNARFEPMERHIKSLTDLAGSLVDNNKSNYDDEVNKIREKGPECVLSSKIFPVMKQTQGK